MKFWQRFKRKKKCQHNKFQICLYESNSGGPLWFVRCADCAYESEKQKPEIDKNGNRWIEMISFHSIKSHVWIAEVNESKVQNE